jgi:2-hydroxy-6-oxonona-2,4-dienedioate hydrolase
MYILKMRERKVVKIVLKTSKVTVSLFLFLIFGIPHFISVTHSQEINFQPFSNSEFVTINEVRIHYRCWETMDTSGKPPVLLVHGFSGSTYTWRHTISALTTAGHKVVAVDIPPYGYSDRNSRINSSFSSRAVLLNDFIRTFGDTIKWHIAGHSMGGGIVQALAILYPEQIQSVTFANGALFTKLEKSSSLTPALLRFPPLERFLVVIGEQIFITEKRVAKLLESAYGAKPASEDISAYLKALEVPGTALAIIRSMTKSKEVESLDASKLQIPGIAIWGDKDTWVPLEYSRKALEMMPHVQIETIEGSAHCPMETHFEIFNSIFLSFLDKNNKKQ